MRGVVALLLALRTLRLFSSPTLAAQASNLAIYFGVDKFVSGESLVWRHDAIILHAASQVGQEREPEEDLKRSGNSRSLSTRTGNEISSPRCKETIRPTRICKIDRGCPGASGPATPSLGTRDRWGSDPEARLSPF